LLPPSIFEAIGPRLTALRRLRFGWVMPHQSGRKDHGAATQESGVSEFRAYPPPH
jgi:hypothetical protein